MNDSHSPSHSLTVYRASFLRVINGANLGDAMSFAEELQPDDIYRLSPLAATARLAILPAARSPFTISADSELGRTGAALHLDCCVTLMSGDGQTTECLILVETDGAENVAEIYVLPLAPMRPQADFALVGVNTSVALERFAQVACVSFTRGTQITMASGAQKPVEELAVGDRVLTRDDGPQEIRWIGHQTVRATGAFAPISIREGTLHNTSDLVVSPDFRLFIYQRRDKLGAGRSEIMVRARHLVNGDTITRLSGGFVDYYQMLFDRHQIVYAEGIAAESMLVDTRTSAVLPEELNRKLTQLIPGHLSSDHRALEVTEALVSRPDAAEILRKSTSG